jgi:hypothetical protein
MSETEENETFSSFSISKKEVPEEYEKLLIKLEADIRNHIKVEQQLKLHIESITSQMEETIKDLKNKCEDL